VLLFLVFKVVFAAASFLKNQPFWIGLPAEYREKGARQAWIDWQGFNQKLISFSWRPLITGGCSMLLGYVPSCSR